MSFRLPLRAGVGAAAALLILFALVTACPAQAQTDDWFSSDKALHFGASAAIAAGSYGIATTVFDCRTGRVTVGGTTALVAGVGKELIDRSGDGTASWKDLAWDLLGAATGVTVAALIDGPDSCAQNESGSGRSQVGARPLRPARAPLRVPLPSVAGNHPALPALPQPPPPYASTWFPPVF